MALDLAEQAGDIAVICFNPFSDDKDKDRVKRAIAEANTFGFKVPDFVEA